MPNACCVVSCHNNSKKNPELTFYRLPREKQRRQKWFQAIRRQDGAGKLWSPTSDHFFVCQKHFITECKSRDPAHPDYVPSIFPHCPTGTSPTLKMRRYNNAIKRSGSWHQETGEETKKTGGKETAGEATGGKSLKSWISSTSQKNDSTATQSTATPEVTTTPDLPATAEVKPAVPNHNESNHPPNEDTASDHKASGVRWAFLTDAQTIESFPRFFHGDYCKPQGIQWAPDDHLHMDGKDPGNIIKVEESWQWLCLDVRGPLPMTQNGHKYILTVTDLYSKWVEALPLQSCVSNQIAEHVMDLISHFGYPFGILSRLPRDLVGEINVELREQLKIPSFLLVLHRQTGSVDVVTQRLIDRMVSDLMEQHGVDWDIYLPAQVFRLCLKEHPKTKERPFSLLCCKQMEPARNPRKPNYTYSKIQESLFVIS